MGGAFGTNFWVDRKEDMIGVLMVQTPGGRCGPTSKMP